MKKTYLLLLLTAFFFVACSSDDENAHLELSLSELLVSNTESTKTFNIVSNVNWEITEHPNWCDIDLITGRGNQTIKVSFEANNTIHDRMGYILIKSNEITKKIKLTQKNGDPYFHLSKSEFLLPNNVLNSDLEITSNISWEIVSYPEWIIINILAGSGDQAITIEYKHNELYTDRIGNIEFKAGDEIKKVNIIQKKNTSYAGKKIMFFGDSQTAWGYYINPFSSLSGCISQKYGTGGSTFAKRTNAYASFVERYQNIDNKSLDGIIVFGGTNDFGNGVPLGTIESNSEYDFYGACNYIFSNLAKDFKDKPIYIVTPLHRQDVAEPEFTIIDGVLTPNKYGEGAYLSDYVQAIKDVARKHGLVVVDAYSESGLNPLEENSTKYFGDGLHINQAGGDVLGRFIYEKIIE